MASYGPICMRIDEKYGVVLVPVFACLDANASVPSQASWLMHAHENAIIHGYVFN